MIPYFPIPYEDELVYSVISRFCAHSGQMSYTHAAGTVFKNKKDKPSIEFINEYTDEAAELLFGTPDNNIVMTHTMFPYYARFETNDRRLRMLNSPSAFSKLFYGMSGAVRFVKYCPICVIEDREKYGECFFHRKHQIPEIEICYKHSCKLYDTNIQISSKSSPRFIAAEECIAFIEPAYTYDNTKIELANYVVQLLDEPLPTNDNSKYGTFLNRKLDGTRYVSARGQNRKLDSLSNDYALFLSKNGIVGHSEKWQIEKLFKSADKNPYRICCFAMFLGISADELVGARYYKNCKHIQFDEEVHRLHTIGLNYKAIAKKLNCQYDIVKSIGEGRYLGRYGGGSALHHKASTSRKDWDAIDNEYFNKVVDIVGRMNEYKTCRPQRVTANAIEKIIGINDHGLKNLKHCYAYVIANKESIEMFWAREIAWVIYDTAANDEMFSITQIYSKANIEKRNIIRALPYFQCFACEETQPQFAILEKYLTNCNCCGIL